MTDTPYPLYAPGEWVSVNGEPALVVRAIRVTIGGVSWMYVVEIDGRGLRTVDESDVKASRGFAG